MDRTRTERPAQPAMPPRNTVVEAPALDEFFLAPEEAPAVRAPRSLDEIDPLQELLLFALAGEAYALPVAQLREIVMPPPLSEVPRARASVLGVTMLRGEVVPVLDPRGRLGLGPRPQQGLGTRVIIVDAGDGPLGLWVDRVYQVLRVRSSALEAPPAGVAGEGDPVARIGRLGERLYGVLDLRILLEERT